jgi:hypothetical protein
LSGEIKYVSPSIVRALLPCTIIFEAIAFCRNAVCISLNITLAGDVVYSGDFIPTFFFGNNPSIIGSPPVFLGSSGFVGFSTGFVTGLVTASVCSSNSENH